MKELSNHLTNSLTQKINYLLDPVIPKMNCRNYEKNILKMVQKKAKIPAYTEKSINKELKYSK